MDNYKTYLGYLPSTEYFKYIGKNKKNLLNMIRL